MKIITITLNPAFDAHCIVNNLEIYKENYASGISRSIGGKGINISRGLTQSGVDNIAYVVLGKQNGAEFLEGLKCEGVDHTVFWTDGRIRENLTVHSEKGETRISFEGFDVSEALLDEIYCSLKKERAEKLIVTFTGRLPKGLDKSEVIEFLSKIKLLGATLIVDCNSFSKDELIKIGPHLIKPNEQEISSMLGIDVTHDNVCTAVRSLCDEGIENVIVSLGEKGFIYANETSVYEIEPPHISPVSTIGAGDSLIAGYIKGIYENINTEDILKQAAAFGTAACLTDATNPPQKEVIKNILRDVKSKKLM